jgi:translation initiation factor IF-2
MARPRVHEVAKELGLSSKEVLEHLRGIGEPVKSHSSTLDEALARRVKSELGDGAGATGDAAPPDAPVGGPPAPTVPEPTPEPVVEPVATEAPGPRAPAPAEEPPAAEPEPPARPSAVRVHRGITVQEFADKVDRSPPEIVKILLGLGEMVTVTQSMSDEAVLLVADEIGTRVEVVDPVVEEELEELEEQEAGEAADESALVARAPVVTVMGHVDHGKTSILDAIRRTDVVGGEAGGITQHIGAYRVHHDGREVTFIDTPGHEAFTAMRARGAQVTDIAVLVVAADDGVMPQTVEAVDHARAANVPIVVAVNKVDKPEADPVRVRQQLTELGLQPEEWGGDTIYVDVSAKQRTNLDTLVEVILLAADVGLDLRVNPDTMARGHVIEAHLARGRGRVATVLVKRGTLYQGDAVLAGQAWGRVRDMLDEHGAVVDEAHPGQPVQVSGWQGLPEAGDEFRALPDEKEARRIASEREQHRRRAADLVGHPGVSLQQLLVATGEGEVPELNVLVKADAQGSVEALADQLTKLDQSLVKVNLLRKGVGAITENDVTLAQASGAIVIGFNVVPTAQAHSLAEEEGVDVREYRVIYQAVQDIEAAARGLLGPEVREVRLGEAEVRETFRVPRAGTVAGCFVTTGVLRRNARARLVRDGTVIYETTIASLKRFKDDVREVATNFECGVGLEGYQDVKVGDVIQAFEQQEVAR